MKRYIEKLERNGGRVLPWRSCVHCPIHSAKIEALKTGELNRDQDTFEVKTWFKRQKCKYRKQGVTLIDDENGDNHILCMGADKRFSDVFVFEEDGIRKIMLSEPSGADTGKIYYFRYFPQDNTVTHLGKIRHLVPLWG